MIASPQGNENALLIALVAGVESRVSCILSESQSRPPQGLLFRSRPREQESARRACGFPRSATWVGQLAEKTVLPDSTLIRPFPAGGIAPCAQRTCGRQAVAECGERRHAFSS